jgi:hypothetical protein
VKSFLAKRKENNQKENTKKIVQNQGSNPGLTAHNTPSLPFADEAKNEPLLGGHLSPELNLFDQILP